MLLILELQAEGGCAHSFAELAQLASAEAPFVSLVLCNQSSFLNPDSMTLEIQRFCEEMGQPSPRTPGSLARCIFEQTALCADVYRSIIRNTIKALLRAMLEPIEALRQAEDERDFTTRRALVEEFKSYPFGAIWDYYCAQNSVPVREEWLDEVKNDEQQVLLKR